MEELDQGMVWQRSWCHGEVVNSIALVLSKITMNKEEGKRKCCRGLKYRGTVTNRAA